MKKIKVEYFTKYNWYGYEGGSGDYEYVSDDIINVYKFVNDELFRRNETSESHSSGFINKLYYDIIERKIIEEVIDYKKELRNQKINIIMK